MGKLLVPASLSLLVAVAAGCGGPPGVTGASDDPESSGEPATSRADRQTTPSTSTEVATTARVVCDKDGTRVLTSRVEAQPDGVHFVIDNRLESAPGFSARHSGGSMGGNAPVGVSKHVKPFPPGTVEIGCYKPRSGGDLGEPDYEALEIVDRDDSYVPLRLQCRGDTAVSRSSTYSSGATGEKVDPVELTRRQFSERLEAGDMVEVGGYPEAKNKERTAEERTVRVVRDGRVIATAHYFQTEGGGWLGDSITRCSGFVPSND